MNQTTTEKDSAVVGYILAMAPKSARHDFSATVAAILAWLWLAVEIGKDSND